MEDVKFIDAIFKLKNLSEIFSQFKQKGASICQEEEKAILGYSVLKSRVLQSSSCSNDFLGFENYIFWDYEAVWLEFIFWHKWAKVVDIGLQALKIIKTPKYDSLDRRKWVCAHNKPTEQV